MVYTYRLSQKKLSYTHGWLKGVFLKSRLESKILEPPPLQKF